MARERRVRKKKTRRGGYFKLFFAHSAGLGVYTKNRVLFEAILANFNNAYDCKINDF